MVVPVFKFLFLGGRGRQSSVSSRLVWSTQRVIARVHREILSPKNKNKRKRNSWFTPVLLALEKLGQDCESVCLDHLVKIGIFLSLILMNTRENDIF